MTCRSRFPTKGDICSCPYFYAWTKDVFDDFYILTEGILKTPKETLNKWFKRPSNPRGYVSNSEKWDLISVSLTD
jgi:hypothetical protein